MTRRAFLTFPAVAMTQRTVTGFHVKGRLGGTDIDGGYFELCGLEGGACGKELLLATPIRSALYPQLKELVGVDIELIVHPA